MRQYIIKRLLLFIPTLLAMSILIFVILRIMPGDIATAILLGADPEGTYTEAERQDVVQMLGLDKPIYAQYLDWLWQMLRFDLGESWYRHTAITETMKWQIPVTLQLAFFASVMVAAFGLPIGVLSALYQDKWPDYILRCFAIVGLAMPTFFVGLLFIIVLSSVFKWLPPPGFANLWDKPWDSFRQLLFPALALGFHSSGMLMRVTRGQMLEVMREDYVRTARAKGLAEKVVIFRHALRNAMLPVITVYGFNVTYLLGGTVIIELIFNIPGMGKQLVNSVFFRDLPVVQTYVLYLTVVALLANLLVDLTYSWLDPRIQYS